MRRSRRAHGAARRRAKRPDRRAARLAPACARLQEESERLLEALAARAGDARGCFQEKLTHACRDLEELRGRARHVEHQRALLRDTEGTAAWVESTLGDFDGLWKAMTPEDRRRLIAALVESVVIDYETSTMRITFADVPGAASGEGTGT